MRQLVRFACCTAAVVAVATAAGVASAVPPSVIVDTNGFQDPPFTPGSLNGQDGWLKAEIGSSSSATVETDTTTQRADGTNRVVHAVKGPDSFAWFGKPLTGVPDGSSDIIQIDWDMWYYGLDQADNPTAFGPFFGVQANDASPQLTFGALGVDSTTNEVLVQDGDSGAFKPIPGFLPGQDPNENWKVPTQEWQSYKLVLDFANTNYTVFVGGIKIAQEDFVDDAATSLTDASIFLAAVQADSVSQSLIDEAFFDNFTITQGLAGDFNDDGVVDDVDCGIWEGAFGVNGDGDADGDGDTDGADKLIWQRNYGIDLTSPPAALAAVSAVPEPGALALSALALFSVAGLLRRKS